MCSTNVKISDAKYIFAATPHPQVHSRVTNCNNQEGFYKMCLQVWRTLWTVPVSQVIFGYLPSFVDE